MKICSEFHPEVCFDDERGGCPVCECIKERDSALAERDETAESLSARIEELLDERDALRTELRL